MEQIHPNSVAFNSARPLPCIDPRVTVLARASVQLVLVEAGEVSLEEAFGAVAEAVLDIISDDIACESCGGTPCFNPGFCATCRAAEKRSARRELHDPKRRPTPQTVIEAVVVSVHERGIAALKEPANLERLKLCDHDAREQVDARIAKLQGCK